jgi:hypothetical protein
MKFSLAPIATLVAAVAAQPPQGPPSGPLSGLPSFQGQPPTTFTTLSVPVFPTQAPPKGQPPAPNGPAPAQNQPPVQN